MLIAEQGPPISYNIYDSTQKKIGALVWPNFPVATNGRLKEIIPPGIRHDISIEVHDQKFHINYTYTKRNFFGNDIEFNLLKDENILHTANANQSEKFFQKMPSMRVSGKPELTLIDCSRLFNVVFSVASGGDEIGKIYEKAGITTRRKIFIDLPENISIPLQCFLLFLICNRKFR